MPFDFSIFLIQLKENAVIQLEMQIKSKVKKHRVGLKQKGPTNISFFFVIGEKRFYCGFPRIMGSGVF
jgi:hypothetical protein